MSRHLREFIRLVCDDLQLLNEGFNFVSHADVLAAIDNALRPERLNIPISGFRDLMREIAIVESGYKVGDSIQHDNVLSGDMRGVFQLSRTALDQLKEKTAVPRTKERFNKSGATQKPWEEQTYDDIFNSLKMQAMAAAMYIRWLYENRGGGQHDLTTPAGRAKFWKNYYNTSGDPNTTWHTYVDKVNKFDGK